MRLRDLAKGKEGKEGKEGKVYSLVAGKSANLEVSLRWFSRNSRSRGVLTFPSFPLSQAEY